MTETMGVAIGIGVFALVFIYLGCLMWKKEKITLLHSYHYDKVSPSDKRVFCKISGWGVIFIGIGLLKKIPICREVAESVKSESDEVRKWKGIFS